MLQLCLLIPALLLLKARGAEVGFCSDYNGTVVGMDALYFKNPCEECECLNFAGEEVGPCTEKGFTCPCETRCCLAKCTDEPHDAASKSVKSNFTIIVTMSASTIIVVLALLFYLYRRRVTSYVRVTRRLYLQRQQSSPESEPKPGPLHDAPPNYEDIATDSGPTAVAMPPRYEDVAPAYSFRALQRQENVEAAASAPPDVSE